MVTLAESEIASIPDGPELALGCSTQAQPAR
jgi:hypothetical protein